MKNKRIRGIITLSLIASPFWWTCGCHSSYLVTNPAEAAGTPIEITTKGNNHYTFSEWSADSSGDIRGSAPFVVPIVIRSADSTIKQHHLFQFMPKDSIAIIEVHRANAGSTVLAVVLTTAAIVIGAVLVFDITLVTTVRN